MLKVKASDVSISELERSARVLESAGNFIEAAITYEKLSNLVPDKWEFALGLAMNLSRGNMKAESERAYRRAALRFADNYWIIFHWAWAAYQERDFETPEQRAFRLLDVAGQQQKANVLRFIGDIACHQRSHANGAAMYRRAMVLGPCDEAIDNRLAIISLYERLEKTLAHSPMRGLELVNSADYSVLAISLDGSEDRFGKLLKAFEDSPVQVQRVPGVRGSYLPTIALRKLCGVDGGIARGTTGCFLSHVTAWETIARNNIERALVVEDDVVPIINLPPRFSALNIPNDFDICFVNYRMCATVPRATLDKLQNFVVFDPIEALSTLPLSHNAPGGDGYFVSLKGAQRLLECVERDGFSGDVDWRLVCYSASRGSRAELLNESSVALKLIKPWCELTSPMLKAYSLFPSLIRTDSEDSIRSKENGIV